MFLPLVDLTEEMGPTQFYPGSHILGNFSSDKLENFSICCDAGAAVIFDYRIKHRGSVNRSKHTSALSYIWLTHKHGMLTGATNEVARVSSGQNMNLHHGSAEFYQALLCPP